MISIINKAEKRGGLKLGQTMVEVTSSNTGIGLAMVCATIVTSGGYNGR